MKRKGLRLKLINLIFLLFTIFVNFLANYLPLNGQNTGEVSRLYQNPFTPAGFTFSIWGLIYGLLIIFVIYQFFGSGKINAEFTTGPFFVIAAAANCSWIFFWHYNFIPFSLAAILILAFSLLKIFIKLEQYNNYSLAEFLALKLPFSIYTAWVLIASLANFMVFLLYLNQDWPPEFLTITAITFILFGLFVFIKISDNYPNLAFLLVIVWAYIGIIAAQMTNNNPQLAVIITAAISILIILFKMIFIITIKFTK